MKENKKKSRETLIQELLTKNTVDVIDAGHLKKALLAKKKIRVKLGVDPSSPDLHIGHIIPLRKMRIFQKLGCAVVFIIGDFTGTIGDPSGKQKTRPALSQKEIRRNMKKYITQAGKIIDTKKCEVRYNSEWYAKRPFSFFADLFSKMTIQRVLERDDFQKRLAGGNDISVLETLYPLFQGYDSVAVRADVEIGGTDQTFNLLMGRKIQRRFGMQEQDIVTCDLLVGTDGKRKMSKSFGNSIDFSDTPKNIFGKIMSVPDALLASYYSLVDKPFSKKEKPMEAKKNLAYMIVEMLHDEKKAEHAKKYFEETFQQRRLPKRSTIIRAHSLGDVANTIGESHTGLRRLIKQKAIAFEGEKVQSLSFIFPSDGILRIGKKKFFKIKRK